MLKRFLRSAALSTALLYNACAPLEEDLESGCQREVLFEDEFNGEELDLNNWEQEVCGAEANYRLREGILEMNVGNVDRCIPYDIGLIIDHYCQSEDDTEKICEIDYVKLSEQ